ncbi:hypothetical protein KM799_02490 [Clostridium tyrobutyricum]|uniref:hypothetical protein n=1 Tax=Clostridium tyrobutyricum TaxID=1519 RepID=UPI001C38C656|nr:hypothetical protein [Clostridium tyrobutyricum]MBV4440115.1 hypothetical protein [Clostridium tyrobutyricum]MBV4445321.1 hypothetical protein [Clostridium tyrobutyricum]MBV4445474.1 hypothetical protein [Clostridium tyrobutyricum]
MIFNKSEIIENQRIPVQITFKETIEELSDCIKAANTLGLLFSITKRNIGLEEKPVYVYYFHILFENLYFEDDFRNDLNV